MEASDGSPRIAVPAGSRMGRRTGTDVDSARRSRGAIPAVRPDRLVAGPLHEWSHRRAAAPAPDYAAKAAHNMTVSLETIPAQPVVGNRTQLRFTIDDVSGFEQYLGAWGHLLAVSDDLIDMMHEHPSRTDGGAQVEFEVVFPREQTYRIWVQFQKRNVVNTLRFDVPVHLLPE